MKSMPPRASMAPHPLVIFAEDWGAHPSSTQHLAKRLMAERDMIWVNSIGLRRPRLSDLGRVLCKIRAMGRKPSAPNAPPNAAQNAPPNAASDPSSIQNQGTPHCLIEPIAVSWPGSWLASAVNRRTLPKQIGAALRSLGSDRPILWTSLPSAVDVVGRLNEIGVIYYAGDDFGSLAGVDHKPVLRQEALLAEQADVIIAASPEIARRFPRGKTFVIPHGVDMDLFSKLKARAEDMRDRGRPIAGFYGALDAWLNIDLLRATAARMPDWDFVFIGPVRTDISALAALKNVRLLGPRDHAALPRYAQHWTVSMLPFLDTAQIRACNPLKLREYMATGRPIVSTPFPAAERFGNHIRFAQTAETFEIALRDSLRDDETMRLARQKAVSDQSWEHRAYEVGILIDALQNGSGASK